MKTNRPLALPHEQQPGGSGATARPERLQAALTALGLGILAGRCRAPARLVHVS